jgi:pyrroline-5-carboxylate reductase
MAKIGKNCQGRLCGKFYIDCILPPRLAIWAELVAYRAAMGGDMRLGFIGTGAITGHILRGLKTSGLADLPAVISPRNADMAQELVKLPGVEIAEDNQDVIDRSDLLVLAVRPQVAESVLRPLQFNPKTPVISLIATLHIDTLRQWTGAETICRAIPLPFVERHQDVTPVFPPIPQAMQLFNALGRALAVDDLAAFDAYGTASALMATYFGMVETAATWLAGQSIAAGDADTYLRGLYANLGNSLAASPLPLEALRIGHSTAGGLNEQLHRVFQNTGGEDALLAGLSSVLARIKSV